MTLEFPLGINSFDDSREHDIENNDEMPEDTQIEVP